MEYLEAINKVKEWLREPDYAEHFGDAQLFNWLDKRPVAEVENVRAAMEALVDRCKLAEGLLMAARLENARLRIAAPLDIPWFGLRPY